MLLSDFSFKFDFDINEIYKYASSDCKRWLIKNGLMPRKYFKTIIMAHDKNNYAKIINLFK
jgi:hypothetical protein